MRSIKIEQSMISRNQDSLGRYLRELKKYPVLTAEEEVLLAEKIKNGDQAALDLLVKSNLRFVVSTAKKYESQGVLLPDLIAEGNIGLITAAKRFDATKGFKFISFAVWWIRQAMQHAIDQKRRIIKLPANQLMDILHLRRLSDSMEQELERLPTPEELSEVSGIELEKIIAYQSSSQNAVSLDLPSDDQHKGLYSILADESLPSPEKSGMVSSLKTELNAFLQALPENEREVLELCFGFKGTHLTCIDDIADSRNVCSQTIRSYKMKGLKLLRENKHFQYMKHHLHT